MQSTSLLSAGGGHPPDPRTSSAQGSPTSPLSANKKSTITERKASSSGTDESLTSLYGDRMRPITNQDIIIAYVAFMTVCHGLSHTVGAF